MASVLTECVRVLGVVSEFFNKLPDHKNVTFEETYAAQDEDPWEYDIAPRKGTVPHAVRGVCASLQELRYLRIILKSDVAAVDTTVQGKGTVDNQNFQTQLIPCTSPVDDHASNRAAETILARESSTQEGKRSSTWDIDNWRKRSTKTNDQLLELDLIE